MFILGTITKYALNKQAQMWRMSSHIKIKKEFHSSIEKILQLISVSRRKMSDRLVGIDFDVYPTMSIHHDGSKISTEF